jgi:hypothetical protein
MVNSIKLHIDQCQQNAPDHNIIIPQPAINTVNTFPIHIAGILEAIEVKTARGVDVIPTALVVPDARLVTVVGKASEMVVVVAGSVLVVGS